MLQQESYKIHLPIFEGPFDLLLHLLSINEMDINDIRISDITQQYLDYIHEMQSLDLEIAGEFLVMASTLLNIKSRLLVSSQKDTKDVDTDEDTILTADDLVRQLIEYRKFKEAAVILKDREEQMSHLLFRHNQAITLPPPPPEEYSYDIALLLKAFAKVISIVETPDYDPQIYEPYTIDNKIEYVEQLCKLNDEVISLEEVFHHCFNRMEIVVTFLAVLELTRMKKLVIEQEHIFGNINISLNKNYETEPVTATDTSDNND